MDYSQQQSRQQHPNQEGNMSFYSPYAGASMYGAGGMYPGGQYGSYYNQYYPREYYDNGVYFPSTSYHNRGWGAPDYAQRWLGSGYGNYDRSFFSGIHNQLGSPSMYGGSQLALAANPLTYRNYHSQVYGGMLPYGGGAAAGGHHHSMLHKLGMEGMAAAAAFQSMRLWENRRRQLGLEMSHPGARDMIHGAAMAEALRLNHSLGGMNYGFDPAMIAQQSALAASQLYGMHSTGFHTPGYVNPYY
ncbi:hypothetical protein IWQ62_001988 [Dispira parvispora]|uniref:Uncharacterized protein n=1 Tax=Dispira parvispora TaxID=1520584 RepID=A0A9W8ARB9_9FUNG|nr:hypothetical protein IWQ62_001988 [Dispira parvispora]